MFDYNSMITRVVDFFPRWMDIRKRYKTSTGGKLLGSIVEELQETGKALDDYKKYYFLDTYEGHEDEVVAFAFKANIGNSIKDLSLLKILNPEIEVTTNLDYFLQNTDKFYYEEGYIYARTEYIKEHNINSLEYRYNDYIGTSEFKLSHVWNIFDEFACFCNIQRQENETNSQLVKRILYHNKNLPNATSEGLKNAIVSELLTKCPDISTDEIEVGSVTPENLLAPYKNFNTLLDKLSEINRDVYKDKKWDLDYWQYDFKSIDYIDHKWNATVKEFINGIGNGDDLEVLIADANATTNVNVLLYDQSAEKLNAYVHDKKIPKKIKFQLKKYNDILNANKVSYKIKASEAIEITNKEIELTAYDESKKIEERNIQDLYKIGSGIITTDNSKISNNNYYRIEIAPNTYAHNIEISKCNVLYKNKKTGVITKTVNLMRQAPGFVLNTENILVNTSMKKGIKTINDFNSYNNLVNIDGGITLDYGTKEGYGVIDIAGMEMKYINISHECKMIPLPKSTVTNDYNSFWTNDVLYFKYDQLGEKSITINTKANKLSFELLDDCELTIVETINGKEIVKKINGPTIYSTDDSYNTRDMNIRVISTNNKQVRLTNFLYNSYDFNINLKYGSLLTTSNNQLMLPGFSNNSMTLYIKTYCGAQPVLKHVYIGSDLSRVKYLTTVIEPLEDCDRIFEISTNATINLIETDVVGNQKNKIEDYNPATEYKAIKDKAWIRINLDEYSYVENIITNIGYKEIIEESGKTYYHIVLKDGDKISKIAIQGNRSVPAKKITLLDMVKTYMPSFDEAEDKIYAAKNMNGLIIEDNGENPVTMVLPIKSDIFEGITSQKYKVSKIPDDLECCFVATNDIINNSLEHVGNFKMIKFYPRTSDVYVAINDYSLLSPETRNIDITNNFNPVLPTNAMMAYTVEALNKTIDFEAKFCNWNDNKKLFEELNSWSLGRKKIALKLKADLDNSKYYDVNTYDIEDDVLLSQHITLKPSYSTTDSNVLLTAEHIVIPPENTQVIYKEYDPLDEIGSKGLIKYQEIIIQSDGFNKLKYSNIDRILHLSEQEFIGQDRIDITDYTLLKEEGIIVWNNKNLINSSKKICIRYIIKEPVAIVYDIDQIYKELDYEVEAYRLLDSIRLTNMTDGQKLDLGSIASYEESDLIQVKCDTPGFESQVVDNYIHIKKIAEIDSVLVKSGYYYLNGQEYYLFTETDKLKAEDMLHINYYNVDKSGGELVFVKKTNNFISNSEMRLKGVSDICSLDMKYVDTKGISNANNLTACTNFNNWLTFGCDLSLKEGLNGLGIFFAQTVNNGYALIEITDKLYDKVSYLSLYADTDLQVSIGEEQDVYGLSFPRCLNIKETIKINANPDSKLRSIRLAKENNKKYYLIVRGFGVIDDIIIKETEIGEEAHIKNISKLGLKIDENLVYGYRYRLTINNNKGVKNTGAGINSKGYIVNTTRIDWGVTILKELTARKDFMLGEYKNISINNDYISTSNRMGYYITEPIFIDDALTIKRLFFKINDIDQSNMKGFKTTILVSSSLNGDYLPASYHNDNIGFAYGDYLSKYVKLKIEIPRDKIINNIYIFAEYKSTKEHAPKAYTNPFGELVSKIYDAQYSADYRIRSIKIDDVSNINDVDIYIRAAKNEYSSDVWLPWKKLNIGEDLKFIDLNGSDNLFRNTRFFQFKVNMKQQNANIKLNNIEIEVI